MTATEKAKQEPPVEGAFSRVATRSDTLFASMAHPDHLRRIRIWLVVFITGLILSGITAFPLQSELKSLLSLVQTNGLRTIAVTTGLLPWIERVYEGVQAMNASYPFLAYGTDWLAFAHLVIAVAFIGPFIDPVRNNWLVTFGLIACAGVIPLALIAGPIRGIPLPWRLVDCSFGVFGSIPLLICRRSILVLEQGETPGPFT
jgi:hypothetical protein